VRHATVSSRPIRPSRLRPITNRIDHSSFGLGQVSSVASVNGPTVVMKSLTSAEITQWHKDDKCFHCDDFFSNGHKIVCKQLFIIEVVDEDQELTAETKAPTISIHALTVIQAQSGKTMHLVVVINDAHLKALLD
jgi:Zn-dependent M28 family amino/carboxypeptidase